MTEVEEQEEYEVRIGAFNGPMDLLVYLVQKKEVPLEQISIAEIADQFLKWVNEYEGTDLSKAGDFLYMASRLMALKVQELLPAEQRDPEMEAEYNEDREQLMKEMLEYQRFKQVASGLQEMESDSVRIPADALRKRRPTKRLWPTQISGSFSAPTKRA